MEEGIVSNVRALEEQPELLPHLRHIWSCFWQASKARPRDGMGGVGGIPLTEVEAVMRLWQITDWDAQLEFTEMLAAMDHEYLTILSEQIEAKKRNKSVDRARE